MKKLILIQAGSTAWQEEGRIQGTVPLPLSDSGKAKLQDLAERLKQARPDVLYSSGNESAGATAGYLGRLCDLKARKMAELAELNCGLWQGLRDVELKRRFGKAYRQWRADPTSVCPPEGESVQQAISRVKEGLVVLAKKNRGKIVVVVAGRMVAALLTCVLTNSEPAQLWQIADQESPMRVFEMDGEPATAGHNILDET